MKGRFNFSPKPFHQRSSPVALLWLLNLLLLAALALSLVHWKELRQENASAHREIAVMKAKQRQIVDGHEKVVDQLEAIDLNGYRKTIRQFGDVQASFSTNWGRLLDDLSELLPQDVRIVSLKPGFSGGSRSNRHVVRLAGEARNKKAQLVFVQTLQERDAFSEVRFESEDYSEPVLAFELSFTYLPSGS